jgi:hypothetical protein
VDRVRHEYHFPLAVPRAGLEILPQGTWDRNHILHARGVGGGALSVAFDDLGDAG